MNNLLKISILVVINVFFFLFTHHYYHGNYKILETIYIREKYAQNK